MSRVQKGSIIRRSDKWYVTYWERQCIDGQMQRKRPIHYLGAVTT